MWKQYYKDKKNILQCFDDKEVKGKIWSTSLQRCAEQKMFSIKISEMFSETRQTCKMEFFPKIVNSKKLGTIFGTSSILNV